MFDTVGTLERSFTPVEGGYLYYPSRWHGGYLVTQEEYDDLVSQWRTIAGWRGIFKLVLLAIVLIMVLGFVARWLGVSDDVVDPFMPFVGIVIVVPIIWTSSAAYRLIRKRTPIKPARSSREAEIAMGRVLGRPMAIWVGVVSLCFLTWAALWALAEPLWGVPVFLAISVLTFLNLRMIVRSFMPKK